MWLQDKNVRTCCECSIIVFMQATSVTYNNVSLANYTQATSVTYNNVSLANYYVISSTYNYFDN